MTRAERDVRILRSAPPAGALVLLVVILILNGPGRSISAGHVAELDPALLAALAAQDQGESVRLIVVLGTQAHVEAVAAASRAARQQTVVEALQRQAEATQHALIRQLKEWQSQGRVVSYRPLWIQNAILVEASASVVNELARRPEVAQIRLDETMSASDMLASLSPGTGVAEPNLTVIGAPALWELGFTGQGIVVASMDTGVDGTHPDLAGRWRGGSNSWYDPYGEHPDVPADLNGHGTWTTGVIVGGASGGTSIGVAPGASWIAVKMFDDRGHATTGAVHLGFQWLLDPDGDPSTPDAPHVVSNSWTFAYPGCNLEFEPDLLALRAAGILPVFAAGNGGSNSGTSYSPANNPSALAAGATDNTDAIYVYSSRGPSACGEPPAIYPDFVAPGVEIRTADRYGLYDSATGTSMAAPHVAGGLALLLSAFPGLSDAVLVRALTDGAVDLGPLGPDNDFGYGRLDLLASYRIAAGGADLAIALTGGPDPVSAGALLTYTLAVSNGGPDAATVVTVTDHLPARVTYVGASSTGWTCTQASGVVSCDASSLGVGASSTITIVVHVPSSVGMITSTATVTAATPDPHPANDSASIDIMVGQMVYLPLVRR